MSYLKEKYSKKWRQLKVRMSHQSKLTFPCNAHTAASMTSDTFEFKDRLPQGDGIHMQHDFSSIFLNAIVKNTYAYTES